MLLAGLAKLGVDCADKTVGTGRTERDLRRRRLNAFALVVLLNIGVSMVLIGVGEQRVLVREAVFSGALAVAALASFVVAPKPLMFYLGRELAGGNPEALARYDVSWKLAEGRRLHRLINTVWAASFSIQTGLALGVLELTLSPLAASIAATVLVSPTLLTLAWTVVYSRQRERRFLAARSSATLPVEVQSPSAVTAFALIADAQ